MIRLKTLRLLTGATLPFLLCSAPAFAQTAEDDSEEVEEEAPADDEEADEEAEESETADDETQDDSSDQSEDSATGEPVASEEADDTAADESSSAESKVDEVESETVIAEPIPAQKRPPMILDEEESPEPEEAADDAKTEEAAAAALTDLPDASPSLLPLKLSTSTWSRLEIRENYDKLGVSEGRTQEGDVVVFRARLGLETNPLALTDTTDALLKFAPQATGQWGQDGTIGEANLGLYEGYFKIRSERFDLQVGRMKMKYGDALVIGDLDWHQKGRAFDGLRVHYKMKRGYVDFFGTQTVESHPEGSNRFLGGDTYFWGAYTGLGEYIAHDLELDAYFLGLSAVGDTGAQVDGVDYDMESATRFTLGSRIKQKISYFDYRLEAGLQFGQTRPGRPATGADVPADSEVDSDSVLAYQADGEIGLTHSSGSRLSFGGAIASGDNPDTEKKEGWDQLFPTAHKFFGLMDVIGPRLNILSGNIKLSQPLTKSLTFKVDGHVFSRLERGGPLNYGEPGYAGTEVDTQLFQKIGKYVLIRGLFGIFIPASGQYLSDDVAYYGAAQAGLTFN